MIQTDTYVKHRIPGNNFVTPTLVETGTVNGTSYEISVGDALMQPGKKLYGLTIENDHDLSNCYDSYNECRTALESI